MYVNMSSLYIDVLPCSLVAERFYWFWDLSLFIFEFFVMERVEASFILSEELLSSYVTNKFTYPVLYSDNIIMNELKYISVFGLFKVRFFSGGEESRVLSTYWKLRHIANIQNQSQLHTPHMVSDSLEYLRPRAAVSLKKKKSYIHISKCLLKLSLASRANSNYSAVKTEKLEKIKNKIKLNKFAFSSVTYL